MRAHDAGLFLRRMDELVEINETCKPTSARVRWPKGGSLSSCHQSIHPSIHPSNHPNCLISVATILLAINCVGGTRRHFACVVQHPSGFRRGHLTVTNLPLPMRLPVGVSSMPYSFVVYVRWIHCQILDCSSRDAAIAALPVSHPSFEQFEGCSVQEPTAMHNR